MRLNPDLCAVICNPARAITQPATLANAWATLIQQRGGEAHSDRIDSPMHHTGPATTVPLTEDLVARATRIRGVVTDIKAARGLTCGPRPSGGPL